MTKKEWAQPQPPPTGPLSRNVRVIQHGSPFHLQLKKRLNSNCPKGAARFKFHPASRALFWDNQPWYWNRMGCYLGGHQGERRPLHRCIWEKANGRPVPPGHFVIFQDGNKNNFRPANLVLCSGARLIARARQYVPATHLKNLVMHRWDRRDQQMTSALLNRFNQRTNHAAIQKTVAKNRNPRPKS
jgi:hypothetical protein